MENMKPGEKWGTNPRYKAKRNKEIFLNYDAGKTIKDLAWIYQLSNSRVRQIINKEIKLRTLREEIKRFRIECSFKIKNSCFEKVGELVESALERVKREGIKQEKILGLEMHWFPNIEMGNFEGCNDEEKNKYFKSIAFFIFKNDLIEE